MGYIQAGDLHIQIVRKRIKNIYLRVLPPDGEVRITAPTRTGDEELRRFALSKLVWIKEQQLALTARRQQMPGQYVTGESCSVWGVSYRLQVEPAEARQGVFLKEDTLILQAASDSTPEQRQQLLDEWYRVQLKAAVPQVLERCEKLTGLCAAEWRVKKMKTRWGSCNPAKRRIWLNLQLAQKPPQCLEYVIIHELAHLVEPSHNARFKAYMDSVYPCWKTAKKVLN